MTDELSPYHHGDDHDVVPIEPEESGSHEADPIVEVVVSLMERQANKSSSLLQSLLTFVLSLCVYVGLGLMQHEWTSICLFVSALLIHELGHFVLMKACGYRNTKIFFIPFFGAAASGTNFNLPGWKRIIVILGGPVTGLIVGAIAGVIGVVYEQPLLTKFALISGFINVFNLLPLLPIDGGWFMYHVLFCRHPLIDSFFRFLGALGLLLMGIALNATYLIVPAVFLFFKVFYAFKVGDIAYRLRNLGLQLAPEDEPGIDRGVASIVVQAVMKVFSFRDPRTLSNLSLETYSLLHARPPGWLGSLFFLGIYVASAVAGTVGSVALWIIDSKVGE